MRRLFQNLVTSVVVGLVTAAGPPIAGLAHGAEPVFRVSLEADQTIVGQPIILRVTVLVPTWLPKAPVFPDFEVADLAVRLPPRSSGPTSETIDGERWSGVTRSYRLYPLVAGEFTIPSRSGLVTFADPGASKPIESSVSTPELVFQSVIPADAAALAPFIAAEELTLEQRIEGPNESTKPGDAFTRTVTARIEGGLPVAIPSLISVSNHPAFAFYPKEPALTETIDRSKVSGSRTESITVVATAGGSYTAPPIELAWYNLRTKAVERVSVDGFTTVSDGPAPTRDLDEGQEERALLAVVAIGGLLLIVLVWRQTAPAVSAWAKRQIEAWRATETYAFRQLSAAQKRGDLAGVMRALEVWTDRLPPAHTSDKDRLSQTLQALGAAKFGRAPAPDMAAWRALAEALRSVRSARLAGRTARTRALPPSLNPGVSRP